MEAALKSRKRLAYCRKMQKANNKTIAKLLSQCPVSSEKRRRRSKGREARIQEEREHALSFPVS
jgi:hypothetical protein